MKLKITLILLLQAFCFQQIYAQCSGADFEEQNGIAILELDSKISGSWRKESTSGASGGSALTYRGSNYFNSPGNSTITYKVKINSSGTYRFIWRNKISVIASHNASTEHNDSWLKINASNFYGQKGSSRIYPGGSGKTPTPEGASSGGWFKVYTNTIDWSYSTKTSDNDAHAVYATFNNAGVYNIQVSARSNGHTIDRMVLYKESSYSAAQAESLSRSVTSCDGGTTTPTPSPTNEAPTVNITSPSNGQTITSGSSVTVQLSSSDPDGNISSHELFVNNSLVDTDGVNYSPYTISNIQPGSYVITAEVTDSNGESDTSTVDITVSGSGTTDPDPEPTPPASNTAPVVSITNLNDGQNVTAGSTVSVAVSSSDSDGSVVQHQIFVNNVLVDTDGANYTPHIIENIASGNYTITAKVTDNSGETTSDTVVITANGDDGPNTDPTPPTSGSDPAVTITNLTNGQSFASGSNVSVNLSASDSDGTIVKYQIFVNDELVDTDGTNYTPHVITNISNGNYEIKATVTDDDNNTNSAVVNIVVGSTTTPPTSGNAAPTVQIITLNEGEVVSIGEEVLVGVTANDSDGDVVKYQVYVNGDLVDTDGATYTSHPFQESVSGSYNIEVVVTDNDGATGSDSVNISVGSSSTPTPPTTTSLTLNLIDAISNVNIGTLTNGSNLSSSSTQNINIRANVPSEAKSVLFELSGAQTETRYENVAPYALFGDIDGDYLAANLSNGSYILKVSAYSDTNGSGVLVATESISFSVGSLTNKTTAYAFPNPIQTDGKVSIHLPKGNAGNYQYTVTNAMGVLLEKGTFKAGQNETDINLELSNVGRQINGVYYLSISKGDSNQIIPLLRQ
ncbi:Ig-like domain-containing protein [Maribacter sp. 1_2014MBL_MicDiv]|uniref:Ig-like domain-containing protein n=1 Tax=Maribacter sp. 1_2014MBL_MicDiv TaxID=1644130 RepID=UPI0008F4B0DF|nr:Ig-like domain-containing protein [Maribacter sp. 1_2014MBL_MicDiv]